MGALAEQHESIRQRLGMPSIPKPRVRADLIRRVLAVEPAPKPYSSFVSMLGSASWRRIVSLVALKHGVMVGEIMGRSRDAKVSAARHEAVWLCYTHLPSMSLPKVAYLFNRTDHTTPRNSIMLMERKRREMAQ